MRDPFQQLTDEHRVIEQMLDALEAAARKDVQPEFYARALEFATAYAEGYHHAKEEERLFTYLRDRGSPRDFGPVDVMVEEHRSGHAHVLAMQDQLARSDIDALRRECLAYVTLMREHIHKEEEVLFPMGRATLTPEEIDEIHAGFATIPEPAADLASFTRQAAALLAEVESAT